MRSGRVRFGVHTPLQGVDPSDLRPLWWRTEEAGFEWISVGDRQYGADGGTSGLDAVAMHAALVVDTGSVTCGCLVYGASRHDPGRLAKVAVTLDRLSGGRAVLALGAGEDEAEHRAFGYPYEDPATRVARLAETVEAVRLLLAGGPVTYEGRFVRLDGAVCEPGPLQHPLPVWIGGRGEDGVVPLAGRVADGWNLDLPTVEELTRKVGVLRRAAEEAGRDPATLEVSVTLGLCFDGGRCPDRYGPGWEERQPAILTGSVHRVTDTVARYREAGADWVILSLRPPFDVDEVLRFAADVAPAFR